MYKIVFTLGLVFLLNINNDAQNFDALIDEGIIDIYSLNFEAAEQKFRTVLRDNPESPSGLFFLSMIDWWKILLDLENESYDGLFFEKMDNIIYVCDKILDRDSKNAEALFFKGGAIGFRGRLRGIRESWLKAADDGREALPIVQNVIKIDPNNKDALLGFGIYNYYAAVIPNQYPFIKPLMFFFPDGDKQLGISQLEQVANEGRFAKYEAKYFLMTLYQNYESNPAKSELYAKELTSLFPLNPVFLKWRGRAAVQRNESILWYEIFNQIDSLCEAKVFGFNERTHREAVYYLGYYFFNLNSHEQSKKYFEKCVELSKILDKNEESGYYVNSMIFLGNIFDLEGNRESALSYYQPVLKMKEFNDSRNRAKMFINYPFGSNRQ